MVYVRTPAEVEVSPVHPIAFEHGGWKGVNAADVSESSGSYTAKWRLFGAEWMIEAELFLTTA